MKTPIACSLNQAQFAERVQLANRLAQQALERRDLPEGVSIRFESLPGRMAELARFVELERACCPFLTFRIDAPAGGDILLELTGPADAQQIIRTLVHTSTPSC